MSIAPLQQAIDSTRSVLVNVQPDQLGSPTPCALWDVSRLINHIVGGQFFFTTMAKGDAVSSDPPPDFSAGDFKATFEQASSACIEAFNSEGAMERIMHLPFGDLPGSVFVGIAATDTFVHGWDLARATGQNSDLAPELAAGLLAGIESSFPDAFRGPEGEALFGYAQPAPDGASNADLLAAFTGRVV